MWLIWALSHSQHPTRQAQQCTRASPDLPAMKHMPDSRWDPGRVPFPPWASAFLSESEVGGLGKPGADTARPLQQPPRFCGRVKSPRGPCRPTSCELQPHRPPSRTVLSSRPTSPPWGAPARAPTLTQTQPSTAESSTPVVVTAPWFVITTCSRDYVATALSPTRPLIPEQHLTHHRCSGIVGMNKGMNAESDRTKGNPGSITKNLCGPEGRQNQLYR